MPSRSAFYTDPAHAFWTTALAGEFQEISDPLPAEFKRSSSRSRGSATRIRRSELPIGEQIPEGFLAPEMAALNPR